MDTAPRHGDGGTTSVTLFFVFANSKHVVRKEHGVIFSSMFKMATLASTVGSSFFLLGCAV